MIVRPIVVFFAACMCIPALAQEPRCPSASKVSSEIKRIGAKAALENAYTNTQRWSCVLEGIESATPDWLSVASLLYSASDAATSSELSDATVVAFRKSPMGVFAVVSDKWIPGRMSVQTVCIPGIEPDEGYRTFFDEAEAKLVALRSNLANGKIKRCLKLIRAARAELNGAPE
jgi:hypothetical protein